MHCEILWQRARLMTLAGNSGLGIVEDGLIACRAGRIVYAGPRARAPALEADESVDCEGRWVTPGLVDCHTHLVYAGDRSAEFEARLDGASYEDLARAGGGIHTTVRATRNASESELAAASLARLDTLLAEGVTTVEIKSGYGLTLDDECKLLRTAQALGRLRPVNVAPTFLGAHAVPEGCSAQDYIDDVCARMIPAVAARNLAEAVDVFCEHIAFTSEQAAQVFAAAQRHGLRVKIHAEQLSNQHGAALAAHHNALSADHLEYLDDAGALALAEAGTVAVLLPGAFYFTHETKLPPVTALRAHGVRIALATDCNPGTSPLTSPLLAMNLGATLFRLSIEECLAGFTREAARALGRLSEIGTLEPGKWCDLAIWNIARPAELVYHMGARPLHARIYRGHIA